MYMSKCSLPRRRYNLLRLPQVHLLLHLPQDLLVAHLHLLRRHTARLDGVTVGISGI
jgi:hypothetical protein